MKKLFIICAVLIVALGACKKDKPANNNQTTVVLRYEFTADMAATYNLNYSADTLYRFATFTGQTWTQSLTVNKINNATGDSARLTVFPPPEWNGTAMQTNATIKIFVNGDEKVTKSAILAGADRVAGLSVITAY